jgi:hypothetical protein
MNPIRWEGSIAVFCIEDFDLFGPPDPCIYKEYYVVESSRYQVYHTDPKFEKDREPKKDKHRYNRVELFRSTFLQLCGARGEIEPHVVEMLKREGIDDHPDRIYQSIRKLLTKYEYDKYYNRIQGLIHALGLPYSIVLSRDTCYQEIENEFKRMSYLWDQHLDEIIEKTGRKYFPHLRYWSLKFMIESGATFQYHFPLLQTYRKQVLLDEIWEALT